MKNIAAMQSKVGSGSFKGWLIGTGCGVLLTMSIVTGTGRLALSQAQNPAPANAVLSASLVTGEGAVPPAIDEYQQYRLFEPAMLSNAELVPPIVEVRPSRLAQQADQTFAGLVPPPVDEIRQLHHVESAVETGAAAPVMLGDTLY